jgi:hypothetical protein
MAESTKTRQARMIAALLDPQHKSQEAACAAAGVPVRTLQNWLRDPDFLAALRQAEGNAIGEATRRLVMAAPTAVAVVVNVMTAKDSPPNVRLRAAGQVLDTLVRLRELNDYDQRLRQLEMQGETD